MRVLFLLSIAGYLAAMNCTLAEDGPPKAAVREVEDEYWGTKIVDPYRWMENVANDAEAKSWLRAQSDFARTKLDALPGYEKLKARISELVNSEPAAITHPHLLANGNLFYLKTVAGQNTAKLYFRKTASAGEVLLVDPDAFGKIDGRARAINFYEPSWDGSHVAFGISAQGSEDECTWPPAPIQPFSSLLNKPLRSCSFRVAIFVLPR